MNIAHIPCFDDGRHGDLVIEKIETMMSHEMIMIGKTMMCFPLVFIWAMVNTHYMVDGHPIHNKDPYNGYYKSLWTIGWLAPINGY